MRVALQRGASAEQALEVLAAATAHASHRFWPDDVALPDVAMTAVIGHRQVTDAYLAGLARANGGRIATLDAALAAAHPDVAVLVPS